MDPYTIYMKDTEVKLKMVLNVNVDDVMMSCKQAYVDAFLLKLNLGYQTWYTLRNIQE